MQSTSLKTKLYVAVVVAAAFAVLASLPPAPDAFGNIVAILGFAILALILEQSGTSLLFGASGSVAFIIHISAAILFGPLAGALVAGGATSVSELLVRRTPLKAIFNAAQKALSIGVAGQVYVLLGGSIPLRSIESDGWPFLVLSILYFATNSLSVSGAISLSTGRSLREVWNTNSRGSLGYDLVASGMAIMVAWFYQRFGAFGLSTIVVPVIVVRSVYGMYHKLQAQSREMLELMVKAIEARDPYTSGHSVRVSAMSRAIAAEMRLPYERVEQISTAALLHDVGKIHEKFAPVLRKEAKLTEDEHRLLQEHPIKSAELVGVISGFKGVVLDSVRSHHERWDGNGYPDGLKGDQVPLGARIIAVADTVDAMRTDRPYRPAATYEEAIRELERCRGAQFDPTIIDVALGSMLVRSMFAAPQDVRGLPENLPVQEAPRQRRSSGWMRVLR
jgi:HD-GYP domain-containing protein (c-di-GMP phosphodiesterase class II)